MFHKAYESKIPIITRHKLQATISAQQMFQTRIRSEDEARSSRQTPNRLVAPQLVELLEERKYVTSQKDMEVLAKKYSVDVEKLERLARHVNSVSVDQDTVRKWLSEDGNENVTMEVSPLISHYGVS